MIGACGVVSEPLGAGVSNSATQSEIPDSSEIPSGVENVDTDREEPDSSQQDDPNQGDNSDGENGGTDSVRQNNKPSIRHIHIDQIGYPIDAPKVAVISSPEVGFNSDLSFEPGAQLEVVDTLDGSTVFAGSPSLWADGTIHDQSGDRGWWFDFSEVRTPGTYYILDPASGQESAHFTVSDDIYEDVLDAALKVFWFNRGNTDHAAEFAGEWSDTAAYIGVGQDTVARSVDTPDDPDSERDLSGGWFDAGDTNKYVTFAMTPVHQLLNAYNTHPQLFDDAVGIPESGNGVPDVLDEVRWEIDWLMKMQNPDGGVLTKVGLLDFSVAYPPSEHFAPRFYEEVCSSSTIAAAGMFAHAALTFDAVEVGIDSEDLRDRAIQAWDWYQSSTLRDDCDPQEVKAGDADLSLAEQGQSEVVAAIYLYALTGERRFDEVVQRGFNSLNPFLQSSFNMYAPHQGDALLYYRNLPIADREVVQEINARMNELRDSSPLYGFSPDDDLYRSFMPSEQYHWGSNMVKANIGYSGLRIDSSQEARERSLSHLHYFHGVNPLGLSYLSNAELLGAENSVQRLHHYWFGKGSTFDIDNNPEIGAPPGYVVGGPNAAYSGQSTPPLGQPVQKSYRDFADGSFIEPTWELTEPAIYYQASYVRLLVEVMAATGNGAS